MNPVMLFFDVAGTTCALDVVWVHGIAELDPLTPVPGAPPVVLGLMHAGGHVAPVLDGRRLLGLEDSAGAAGAAGAAGGPTEGGGMVVVLEVARDGARVRVGLAVDDVHGVAALAAPHLESCAVVLDPLELFALGAA